MPILNSQASATATSSDGKTIRQMPPQEALQMVGPVIPVTVTVFSRVAQQLLQQGAQIPGSISGYALVDTGASITCVDEDVVQSLGISPMDKMRLHSASQIDVEMNIYPITFSILSLSQGNSIDVPRAAGAALKAQNLIMLIGRDVLAYCTLHYNGLDGSFTFAI